MHGRPAASSRLDFADVLGFTTKDDIPMLVVRVHEPAVPASSIPSAHEGCQRRNEE
jgi:hypothetical protein